MLATLQSCEENPYKVDVSDIDINLSVKRLDIDLFEFSIEKSAAVVPKLDSTYGMFFDIYNRKILQIGGTNEAEYPLRLSDFLKYCTDNSIQDTVIAKFSNLKQLESELSSAMKHYKFYFPEKQTPEIITCLSAFNESVFTYENQIGIALDKFLGADCVFYERLVIEKYLRRSMTPEMIPVQTMQALAKSQFPYESTADDLLDNMIYEGKIQYFMQCMLPEHNEKLKWRYTTEQMEWAKRNESKVWNYMIENKKLFETDRITIRQYVGEAPFTTPFTDVSAPRIAAYIGFRIVEKYMQENTDVDLPGLMNEKDAKKILSLSKYNPK